MKKRAFSLLLTLALILGPIGCASAELSDYSDKLVILHTNDIHGHAVSSPADGILGYSVLARLRTSLIEAGASVLLLDAGDACQGTPLVNLSSGASAVEFMNAVGYDAMVIGNHEFDYGIDMIRQVLESAEFTVLGANILRSTDSTNIFDSHIVFDTDCGIKVGVFGLTTPEAYTKSNPANVRNITFQANHDLYVCAQEQIDALKDEGCALIVCLGHLGTDSESMGNRSIDVIENTEGIDLFIDGHSHSVIDGGMMVNETLLTSTGCNFANIGMAVYDGESLCCSLISASADKDAFSTGVLSFAEDETMAALVNDTNAIVEQFLCVPFAKTEVLLNGERAPGNRTEETNLGDFSADALLWAARKACGSHVDAAIINGGGIRASIQPGDISMLDMKTVFPFNNELVLLTVTGSELLEAIEASTCSIPVAIGSFPQVSGITYCIDTSVAFENGGQYPDCTYFHPANPGTRVTIESVNGEAFDLEKEYLIATTDFISSGGDAYYVFKYPFTQTGILTGISLEDALISYVREVLNDVIPASLYAVPQGRITIK